MSDSLTDIRDNPLPRKKVSPHSKLAQLDNKLILVAKFMGGNWVEGENLMVFSDDLSPDKSTNNFLVRSLKYDKSADWLLLVWKKLRYFMNINPLITQELIDYIMNEDLGSAFEMTVNQIQVYQTSRDKLFDDLLSAQFNKRKNLLDGQLQWGTAKAAMKDAWNAAIEEATKVVNGQMSDDDEADMYLASVMEKVSNLTIKIN